VILAKSSLAGTALRSFRPTVQFFNGLLTAPKTRQTMKRGTFLKRLAGAVGIAGILPMANLSSAQEHGIINNAESPHITLKSVNIGDCRWTTGSWADKAVRRGDGAAYGHAAQKRHGAL
jgi:hypothetical protein